MTHNGSITVFVFERLKLRGSRFYDSPNIQFRSAIITLGTHQDERTVLYKTKSLDGTKHNTNTKTNPNPNTNPNPKLILILTLWSKMRKCEK